MFEQFNAKQFITISKQFSDAAFRAQGLAIEHFEKAVDAQMKTLEKGVNATVGFWSEASEVRDAESARTLFPKSVQMAKDSAQSFYSLSQELAGLTVKTTEGFAEVARGSFEVANDAARQGMASANDAARQGFAQANDAVRETIQTANDQAVRNADALNAKRAK